MNILVVDDHELFRTGLRHLLVAVDEDIHYVGTGSVEEALRIRSLVVPDLILLDYFLPEISGQDALKRIRDTFDSSVIVVLSSLDDPALIRQAIENGASGFIPKASSQSQLISALKLILEGGVYLPKYALSSLKETLIGEQTHREGQTPADLLSQLTDRQRDVVKGLTSGKANKVIADELNISEGTVKSHLSSAFKTLGVSNRTQAVVLLAECHSTLR